MADEPATQEIESSDPQVILQHYKDQTSQCQTLANKITELQMERDEHKLVIDTLSKLEPERKAFRLVGGVLVERTVEEVLPAVTQNYDGVRRRNHDHDHVYSPHLSHVHVSSLLTFLA